MVDESDVAAHIAALMRVRDELLAELETTQGRTHYAEVQPLLADVEWALSRCHSRASEPNAPRQS